MVQNKAVFCLESLLFTNFYKHNIRTTSLSITVRNQNLLF